MLWWREALEGIAKDQIKKHPILVALARHIKSGVLDPDLLVLMVENRFKEFYEPAKTFDIFIQQRRAFLQPFYGNTNLALGAGEVLENFEAFVAFDIIGCLQNLNFYTAKEIIPFEGKVETAALEKLLKINSKNLTRYFRGLRALAVWHYKRLARVNFAPELIKTVHQHPGKVLALWRA